MSGMAVFLGGFEGLASDLAHRGGFRNQTVSAHIKGVLRATPRKEASSLTGL
jgi:hypothetical protein